MNCIFENTKKNCSFAKQISPPDICQTTIFAITKPQKNPVNPEILSNHNKEKTICKK